MDLGALIKSGRLAKNMSQQAVADAVNVSKQAISQYENGHSKPHQLIQEQLYELLDLSTVAMSFSEPGAEYKVKPIKVASVPIYDVEFAAGVMTSLIESREDHFPVGYLALPEVSGCDAIIRAKGDSMADRINDRDWIGIKRIENWQEWFPMGYIYAIITDQTELIKYIKKGSSPDTFKIVSHNDFYEDDEIPKHLIKELWSVKAIIPGKIETLI